MTVSSSPPSGDAKLGRFDPSSLEDRLQRHYIGGQWVDGESGQLIDVVDPSSEEAIGAVPAGTAGDADRAVLAARAALGDWSATSIADRKCYLDAIVSAMKSRADDIAEAITREMGAPAGIATDIQFGLPLKTFEVAAELLPEYQFEYELNGATIVREPIGVVGAITPWNFPLHQVALKVAPALATGCTIVVKPSEIAPLSSVVFAEIIDSAGVPSGVFNLVHGTGHDVGERLAVHPQVDMVSFTGSTRAGRRVSELAAHGIKRVALELGGKSANVILEDADLEQAVTAGVADCYFNAGQTCNAQTRMLVPRVRLREAEEIARRAAESHVVGPPSDDGTTIGPLVSGQQRDRVRDYIDVGIQEGARVVTGGAEAPTGTDRGYYVQPTVFSDVSPNMTIAREEIFGPVLSMIPYDTEDDAVQIANDSVYGLGGGVWAGSQERALEIARRLQTGQVYVNGAGLNFHAPFGGYKQSGNGREWGPFGFEEYLEVKALMH